MMIRTSRLLLRPHFPEDARELFAAIANQRVVRMLSRAPWPYRLEHAEAFCARPLDPRRTNFAITLPEWAGAPIIGGIGLDMEPEVPEIGYWIAPEFWGQGYVSEALDAVLTQAVVLGVERVQGTHLIDNPRSGAVLLKAGFVPTGEAVSVRCEGRGSIEVPAIRYQWEAAQRQEIMLTVAA